MATASLKRTVVCGLGEIALRVNDLDAMQRFYEQVIGLPLMARFPNSAFFKIADGYGGHTQVLALFDRSETAEVMVRQMPRHPRSITSLSRFLSPTSMARGRDWRDWGFESKPPNMHGYAGALFTSPIRRKIK